jgi:RimJ/RimL family protein N-acetyltransferase
MAYDSKLKIDLDIFKDPVSIDIGGSFLLTPIYHSMLDSEAMLYTVNCNNDKLKKYLPLVYADNKEKAQEILLDFLGRTGFKQSLLLCIRPKAQKFPIGYIHFNTPIAATGLNDWSVDFWLGPSMQGKGIMSVALSQGLLYLQKYKVPQVKALVDKTNIDSIKVLERVGFIVHEEEATRQRLVYKVGL